MNNKSYSEYVGNLHIHSQYSDGAGTVNEIAQSAQKVGLDFIIINDHDFMADDLHLSEEGFYEDVVVLLGLEIGEKHHHYLAYDLNKMVKGKISDSPQDIIDRVNSQGGFGFLAHPFEKGMPFKENSVTHTWNDFSVTGFSGICIWNFASRWKERVKNPLYGIFFLLFKSQALKGPSIETLAFWDGLCRKRKVVAIGGSDAHGTLFRWGIISLRPFSYEFLLRSITVHILLETPLSKDFHNAKGAVYKAIKEGRLFIAHENIASSKGFRYYYVSEDGYALTMGEERPFEPGMLFIETPEHSMIRLLRDGFLEKSWLGKQISFRIKRKGVYRIEVYYRIFLFGWRPWIFSNPIYLK